MLKYVSEHNDFYKNRIKEYGIKNPLDITQWPVLTRKELQENRYNMFSDGYKSKYYSQKLRRQVSSGSSGTPVTVYWDECDWYASNLSLWRKRWEWYSIKPSDKHIMFTLNSFGVKSDGETLLCTYDPSGILWVNSSVLINDSGLNNLIDKIDEYQPMWLYIQPSTLDRIIRYYMKTGRTPPKSIQYIESVGEILSDDLRNKALNLFAFPINNMYGSEEMNGIAFECPYHHLHILEDNVYLECENNGNVSNEVGNVILTNLNNYSMPLIRYSQGDRIVLSKTQDIICPCGNKTNRIDIIRGRSMSYISLRDGMEIDSYIMLDIIAEVNNLVGNIISEYRFIYSKSLKTLDCYFTLDKKMKNGRLMLSG